MDAGFWHDKWAAGQIGFHEPEPHPLLQAHWTDLDLAPGARVLVPLCGKSNDMPWLAAAGMDIVGIELSEIAIDAFFREHGLTPTITRNDALVCYSAPGYTLYCGDFFELDGAHVGALDAIYDRASLIALPPTMRRDYVERLTHWSRPGTVMLLITVDYEQTQISPPPFVVGAEEVGNLYQSAWRVDRLATAAAAVKGKAAMETAYQLRRDADHA